jgi:hypothetical protein
MCRAAQAGEGSWKGWFAKVAEVDQAGAAGKVVMMRGIVMMVSLAAPGLAKQGAH